MKEKMLTLIIIALTMLSGVKVIASTSEEDVQPLGGNTELYGWLEFGSWSDYWLSGPTQYLTLCLQWNPTAQLFVYFYDMYKNYVGVRDLLTGGFVEKEYEFSQYDEELVVNYLRFWYHDYYEENNVGEVYYWGYVEWFSPW